MTRLFALIAVLGTIGCTHTMEVKNLRDYSMTFNAPRSLKLSVKSVPGDAETGRPLTMAAKDGLSGHSSVERVTMIEETPPDFTPDYVVTISPRSEFTGSGWNYLVSFPGFLIFTHAWNGYVYEGKTTTQIEVRRPASQEVVASKTVETTWDMRHCDFGRGAWTSSGWYTPGYGGLNLVIGFFMIKYDDGATEPLVTAVHGTYGRFIANHVVALAAGAETPAAAESPPPSDSHVSASPEAMAPPVPVQTDPPSAPPSGQ